MQKYSAVGAIMLDGGNSTAMYVKDAGVLKDTGSPVPLLGQRMIPNAIFISLK
jgi:exopolysaccharide biosynthesis protein